MSSVRQRCKESSRTEVVVGKEEVKGEEIKSRLAVWRADRLAGLSSRRGCWGGLWS